MKARISKGKWILIALALLTAMFIAACGGSGGVAGGGIGGTGKSVGVAASLGSGSINVNGVDFQIGTATVTIDDSPGSESDLELGMVVTVDGDFNDDGTSGTAMTVSSNDVVEGPVTSAVNTTERSFQVMGQEVFYTATTIFEISGGGALAPTDLDEDNVVEVSGLVDSAGQIKATRVERKAIAFTPGDVLEVNGLVATLNTTTETFTIGALNIDYSATTTFDNGTVNDLAVGVLVEVKGDDDPSDGLEADKIEFKVPNFGNNGDLLQFEGVVTSIASSTGYDFEVNGLPVDTNGSTQWRGGYTALADVTLDDRVEVDGTVAEQGGTLVLLAREVELEIEEDVKVEAYVESVDTTGQTLTILGITFAYDGNTEFEDKSGGMGTFTASDINATAPSIDWLQVRGYIDNDGTIIATEVDRDNDDEDPTENILQGPVADVPASGSGDFTILSVTIAVDGVSGIQYTLEDSDTIETTFFNNLTNGRVVKARGTYDGAGEITPEELDLQN